MNEKKNLTQKTHSNAKKNLCAFLILAADGGEKFASARRMDRPHYLSAYG